MSWTVFQSKENWGLLRQNKGSFPGITIILLMSFLFIQSDYREGSVRQRDQICGNILKYFQLFIRNELMKMGLVIEILAVTLSLFILVGLHVWWISLEVYYLKRCTMYWETFKYADLLKFEFQHFPEKNIKKVVFIKSVTRYVRSTVF